MKHPIYLILFSMLLIVSISACVAPPLPTPSEVISLPSPNALTYEANEANQTGIYLDPGATKFVQVEEGNVYAIFFAGKNEKGSYIAYYSAWDFVFNFYPDWEPIEIAEDGSAIIDNLLDVTGETRPHCVAQIFCFTEDHQILVEFEGGVLK